MPVAALTVAVLLAAPPAPAGVPATDPRPATPLPAAAQPDPAPDLAPPFPPPPPPPLAPDNCAAAYERAQELRSDGRLRAARSELLTCAQPSCPQFVVRDCRRWLDEVEVSLPTVVFIVRNAGRDIEQVTVYRVVGKSEEGDELVATHLDGRAMPMDPGKQTFTFEVAGLPPRRVEVVVAEGQKRRLIEVEMSPVSAPPPRTLGAWPLVFAGVGAAGLAGFAGFGLAGWHQETRLEERCAPACSDDEVKAVRRRYLIADISLGVGLASLGVASYLYITRGRTGTEGGKDSSLAVGWMGGPGVGAVTVGKSF
jgi:hypothetical protein